MQRSVILFWMFLAVWTAAYAASFWVLLLTDPTGDGMTRGLNRVSGFFGWQIFAAAVAMMLWATARSWARGAQRWLARIPGLLAIGLIVFVLGLIGWVQIMKPGQTTALTPPPPKPATQPVDQ